MNLDAASLICGSMAGLDFVRLGLDGCGGWCAWLGSHGIMWPPRGSGHAHPREHCVPSSLEEQGQCKRQQGVGVDVGRDVGGCSRSS